MAMASKAKMLLRELKTVRGDLTFLRDRCAQLEEENRRLRESVVKGTRPDEDDLVLFPVFSVLLVTNKCSHSVMFGSVCCQCLILTVDFLKSEVMHDRVELT